MVSVLFVANLLNIFVKSLKLLYVGLIVRKNIWMLLKNSIRTTSSLSLSINP